MRCLIAAIFAAAAMLSSATPSSAVNVGSGTFFPTDGSVAKDTFGRVTGLGAFSDGYDFTLTSPASLEAAGIAGVEDTGYSALNIQLVAVGGGASFKPGPGESNSEFSFQSASVLTAGVYELIITGVGTSALSEYSGEIQVAFRPSAVPLPGALVLMGSVLLGGAGFGRWRRTISTVV